ncbi:shikimate kinase AroK [Enterobacteriaceae endosymbiont of Macroplea appendiculata]|uniref:shikimate kinase AroK n=1 Tax=Enterobacteriaceae endosymbiont of Macroplea appendiculata TaxID=2675790 RepID=UPI001449D4FB|nr:shikimate kinase AroK [Enterobacteriaceae endosymbiont of Macroplea appendiculata]QJC30943.1 shikimate kinase AroK [Enterobacteriaceae endosymbiont of Macroplea appendiculata]
MAEKRNIFLIGPMGAGKSTIGRQLAHLLNMDFFDSDQEIERRTGADISWVFDVEGEEGFRQREKKIINEVTHKQGIILATGGGSILLEETRKILSSRGIVIYLTTTIEQQLNRTKRDKKRPLLHKQKNLISQKKFFQTLAKDRNHLYASIADITIATDEHSAKIVANQLVHLLDNI